MDSSSCLSFSLVFAHSKKYLEKKKKRRNIRTVSYCDDDEACVYIKKVLVLLSTSTLPPHCCCWRKKEYSSFCVILIYFFTTLFSSAFLLHMTKMNPRFMLTAPFLHSSPLRKYKMRETCFIFSFFFRISLRKGSTLYTLLDSTMNIRYIPTWNVCTPLFFLNLR